MADNAETSVAVHQVSHVIQKLVDVLKNVPQVGKDTVVHNIVMLSHMAKTANQNAFVVRMHLTAMYEAESASANQGGSEINAIKNAPRVNMGIIARKNASVPMENALMTQVFTGYFKKYGTKKLFCIGKCVCSAGYTGATCELECDADRWGKNCASLCQCGIGKCNSVDGTCNCPPGKNGPKLNMGKNYNFI